MKYVTLPDEANRQLSFYLAMEEYVARHLDADDYFFMWQVEPSVIFGRHQVAANEVNFDYCREHGIRIFRRKSGGGCVYADRDNVMMSFVTPEENVGLTFNRFINMLLLVLRKMGVKATSTTHNDVMIGDRKVSGTAFYHLPGRSIVHGTMLYDTNMDFMLNAITPGKEKLQAKGIESVRQRVTLLKDYTSLTLDEFKALDAQTQNYINETRTFAQENSPEALTQKGLGQKYIENLMEKDPSYIQTPTGLVYKMIEPGKGNKFNADDKIKVMYKGTHVDGKTFDESKEPVTFAPNQVVPGFREALLMMRPGAKMIAVLPQEIAYGARGAGQEIKPFETLVFEIETLGIDSDVEAGSKAAPSAEETSKPVVSNKPAVTKAKSSKKSAGKKKTGKSKK